MSKKSGMKIQDFFLGMPVQPIVLYAGDKARDHYGVGYISGLGQNSQKEPLFIITWQTGEISPMHPSHLEAV